MALSYLALVVVNNSGFETENMWIIYTPMFIGVYVFSRWLDSRIGRLALARRLCLPRMSLSFVHHV